MLSRKWADPDKEVTDYSSIGVETSIEEGRHVYCRISHLFFHLIFLFDVLPFGFVQLAYRKRKVSEVRLVQEEFCIDLISEVCNRPREDVIL